MSEAAVPQPTPEHSPTDCSEVLRRAYEFIDDEMTEVDYARFRAHLDECGECMTAYERDRLLKALVRRSCRCETAPETLRLSILTRITTLRVEYWVEGSGRYDDR